MPRAVSKADLNFGLISIGAGKDALVWIDREAKQLIVGSREFDLSQLSQEQRDRLQAMERKVWAMGEANDTVRAELAVLVDELIRQHTH